MFQIWANIQPNDQPARISFDLGNTSLWKPFFHKGFSHPGFSSVQVRVIKYISLTMLCIM